MSERKEMSTEMRSLLAAVLCLLVIAIWSMIYKPQQPPVPPKPAATATNPAAPALPAPSPSGTAPIAGKSAATAAPIALRAAGAETAVVVESDLYRVEIFNRGAVVRSWQLKKFDDDHKPPRTLDLVHPDSAQASGS